MALRDYTLDLLNVHSSIVEATDPGANIIDMGRAKDVWRDFYYPNWNTGSSGWAVKFQVTIAEVAPNNLSLQCALLTSEDGVTWTTLTTSPAVAGPHTPGTVLADIALPNGIQRLLRAQITGGTPTAGFVQIYIHQQS